MGQEIRRVPLDWQHPTDEAGEYRPQSYQTYRAALAEHQALREEWLAGGPVYQGAHETAQAVVADPPTYARMWHQPEAAVLTEWRPFLDPPSVETFFQYGGLPPTERASYREREWGPDEPLGYQIYETVSDGTPFSPVFATRVDLVAWLIADQGVSRRAAERFAEVGSALSAVMFSDGTVVDGLTALAY